jgi:hypothetical protein
MLAVSFMWRFRARAFRRITRDGFKQQNDTLAVIGLAFDLETDLPWISTNRPVVVQGV